MHTHTHSAPAFTPLVFKLRHTRQLRASGAWRSDSGRTQHGAEQLRAHDGPLAVTYAVRACDIAGWSYWPFLGTLAAALAVSVALGAFAAHGVDTSTPAGVKAAGWLETGSRYQAIHALAVLAIAALAARVHRREAVPSLGVLDAEGMVPRVAPSARRRPASHRGSTLRSCTTSGASTDIPAAR